MKHYNFFEGTSTGCDTIIRMLNEDDKELKDEMTKNWRNHKLEELNFVGTLGALLASCLSSTSSWPDVLPNGKSKPWLVRGLLYGGLVLALFSVVTAGVQSMRLHRLSAHPDGLEKIRNSLGRRRRSDNKALPSWLHVYAWEFSLAFLVLAVLCMVVGLTILIWAAATYGPWKPEAAEWWDGNAKVIHSLQSTHKHDISGFPNIQVDTDKYSMEEVSYPFFVYGTLRALPLLAHALTGDSKNTLTVTANMVVSRVHHYSRWGIENHDFAGAIEDPYGSMDGLLLYLSQAHRYRLESLRGPLFATKHVTVTLQSDMNVGADMWVFRGPSELLSNKPWSFDNFFHNVLSTWNLDGPEEPSRRRA
ncbi:unnamed protein product [Fusarium graminearum]|nr:hypothetical protein FGRA07_10771 [Fusarium graminearum]CAG1964828.1 unnamed protein product [Fusarium graminearum]